MLLNREDHLLPEEKRAPLPQQEKISTVTNSSPQQDSSRVSSLTAANGGHGLASASAQVLRALGCGLQTPAFATVKISQTSCGKTPRGSPPRPLLPHVDAIEPLLTTSGKHRPECVPGAATPQGRTQGPRAGRRQGQPTKPARRPHLKKSWDSKVRSAGRHFGRGFSKAVCKVCCKLERTSAETEIQSDS